MRFIPQDTSAANYQRLLKQAQLSNLLQSYPYALAIRKTQQLQPKLFVIEDGGIEKGFFQTHEASILFGAFHVMTADRAPLWFKGYGKNKDIEAFIDALNVYCPKKWGRSRRFMPELEASQKNATFFQNSGWIKRQTAKPYETITIDLTPEEEALRAQLKRNWRNHLSKAERADLECVEGVHSDLEWFLKGYLQDRMQRLYPGPGLRFLTYLLGEAALQKDLLLLKAIHKGTPIAACAFITHGNSATYQVGWTTPQGRAVNAHHFLLWKAMLQLKKRMILSLDLGGINTETAKGVTEFKDGMGGKRQTLIGQFG